MQRLSRAPARSGHTEPQIRKHLGLSLTKLLRRLRVCISEQGLCFLPRNLALSFQALPRMRRQGASSCSLGFGLTECEQTVNIFDEI